MRLVNPQSESDACYRRCYCAFCEALVFGDQAPGFQLVEDETERIICQDCVKYADKLSTRIPSCNHHEALVRPRVSLADEFESRQQVDTNHPHWLAVPCLRREQVEAGVYCDGDMIPEFQRVMIAYWHCFKLVDAELVEVRQVFDNVGLKNDLLCRLIGMALEKAFDDPMENMFLCPDG